MAALPLVYQGIPIQRCWAHKTRNVHDHVRKADREKFKTDLHKISYAAKSVKPRGLWGSLPTNGNTSTPRL